MYCMFLQTSSSSFANVGGSDTLNLTTLCFWGMLSLLSIEMEIKLLYLVLPLLIFVTQI